MRKGGILANTLTDYHIEYLVRIKNMCICTKFFYSDFRVNEPHFFVSRRGAKAQRGIKSVI